MFSLGEVVILLAVGSWAFGPRELPRMGRALGKLTGKATGFIYKARAQLFDFAEKAELTKVQQELQMTMNQLQAIRSELQGGINILDPGPLSRQILRSRSGSGTSSSLEGLGSRSTTKLDTQNWQQNNLPFAASGVAAGTGTAEAASRHDNLGSFQGAAQSISPLHKPQNSSVSGHFDVLPISAAAAGLVPDRSHSMPAASEILADALQEEKVAHQALQFFQQQPSIIENTSSGTIAMDAMKKKTRKPRTRMSTSKKKGGGTEE